MTMMTLMMMDIILRYMDVTLDDLEVIATLGVGGFGRVEMVKVMMIIRMMTVIVLIMMTMIC